MENFPLIIAHRGASAVAPENTLAAFHRALADNADGVECDVRLAGDYVPVVFHDPNLKRTALRNDKVNSLTSRELSRIEVGTWFNLRHPKYARREYTKETVPTLETFFELMSDNRKLIYVEMKCEDESLPKLARKTAELIIKYNLENRTVVKSFELESLIEIKEKFPCIRTAALFSPRPWRILNPKDLLVKPALRLAADELSLHYSLATGKALRRANAADLRTIIWTADHPAWVNRAFKLGIYGIITNNPARLLIRRNQMQDNGDFDIN